MPRERNDDVEVAPAAAATEVPRLIEMATNSTEREVDPRLLKAIKSTVRSSDDGTRDAARALMDQMKKQHSQVRYLAVLIIDELFMRSKLFRSLFVVKFDQFLSLSIGFRRNLPLPPPFAIATTLRLKTMELLEKWNASFGVHYRQLRLGFDYLKNTLRYQFPNQIETAARLQQERREREIRTKEILLDKFERFKEGYSSIKCGIQSTIDEIGECLEILHAKEDDSVSCIPTDDEEVEEFKSLALQQIRLDSLKEGEKVHESSENKAVFDALRELQKLLVSKHLPSVQGWISVLMRVDLTDNRFRDTALKELIDLRNLILSVKNRCAQLGCTFDDIPVQEEDEEDLWVEGKVETQVVGTSPSAPNDSLASLKSSGDTTPADKGISLSSSSSSKSSVGHGSNPTSERSKLLAEAPVVTWGPFLDNWGSNRDVLANQRGLEVEGHWGRVDYDAVIPARKIAELNVHRSVYKENPVEILPCHAPLKKGGLCQRRDLKVCPFHGPIIPRDEQGNPIQQTPTSEVPESEPAAPAAELEYDLVDSEQEVNLSKLQVEQLAKQAVKNVRERDEEVRASKRARLARVREHNEAVLRDAAVASTLYSQAFGAQGEGLHGNGSGTKGKKPTLASMLRKKVTAKDRIAQRLLRTSVTEASSRELMQGEDSKYREAFPNQW